MDCEGRRLKNHTAGCSIEKEQTSSSGSVFTDQTRTRTVNDMLDLRNEGSVVMHKNILSAYRARRGSIGDPMVRSGSDEQSDWAAGAQADVVEAVPLDEDKEAELLLNLEDDDDGGGADEEDEEYEIIDRVDEEVGLEGNEHSRGEGADERDSDEQVELGTQVDEVVDLEGDDAGV